MLGRILRILNAIPLRPRFDHVPVSTKLRPRFDQFRAGTRRDSLETPGGLLEPGEDPCAAGARELLEETGYAGDPPERLGTLWPNPALLTMGITTIVIRNARRVAEPHLDPSEELAVELVPVGELPALIRTGRIDHAVCVAGLLWWLDLNGAGPAEPSPL